MVDRIRPTEEPTVIESSRVRGRPFPKGNPGRPPGSKNKLTRLLEELVENEGETLTRKYIELAKGGNVRCLQYLLDRLMPQLEVQLPTINGVHDIAPAMAAITNQLNRGDLTLEEASDLIGLLERYGRVFVAHEIPEKVEKVEAQLKQMKTLPELMRR